MISIIKNHLNKSFVRNVLVMATGAAAAQGITMIASPLITRIYGPEAFGILGTFIAIFNIITPIVALTYPIAIVLPREDKEAKGLVKLSLYITFIISTISAILIVFFHSSIVNLFQLENVAPYLYLIPFVVIFSGFLQVSEQWLIRTNQFKINAKVKFLQSVIINGSKIGIGLLYPVAVILVLLQVVGEGLRAFLMTFFADKSRYKKVESHKENKTSLSVLAKKYKDFPLFRAPEVFLSSFSQSLPVFLLTVLFGPASAGFYNIGRTVLALPSMLIGQSVGDVFYPRITEAANNKESLTTLIIKATSILAAVGIVPFGIIIMFGPTLFEFVFGAGWSTSGEYARWIALASFSIFINKPAVRTLPVIGAQRFHLIFTFVMLVTRAISLILGFFLFDSDIVALALFGLSGLVLNLILIISTLYMTNKFMLKNNSR